MYQDKPTSWLTPREYFSHEPPTRAEVIVLATLKALCDDGDGDIADLMSEAFLRSAPDQRASRRRAHALLRMAVR